MCPSGATCLSADCCFSEIASTIKYPTQRVDLVVQSGYHHHLIEVTHVPDEGHSRNVPDEGHSRNVPDEGHSRNVSCASYLISIFY